MADGAGSRDLMHALCRCFLRPGLDTACLYPDTIPVLEELRGRGYRLGIVSNTFWGSPADLWHAEAVRHGLGRLVDEVVFCTDVGWRKPAPQIFYYTVEKLGVRPEDCLFVGDDLSWDVQGPRALGMEALLLDRDGNHLFDGPVLRTLYEVYGALGR